MDTVSSDASALTVLTLRGEAAGVASVLDIWSRTELMDGAAAILLIPLLVDPAATSEEVNDDVAKEVLPFIVDKALVAPAAPRAPLLLNADAPPLPATTAAARHARDAILLDQLLLVAAISISIWRSGCVCCCGLADPGCRKKE